MISAKDDSQKIFSVWKLSFAGFLLVTGCSVYKSQGRKNFESNAPAQVQNQPFADNTEQQKTEMCWTQPRKDNLWNIQEGHLSIKYLSETDMEVCLFPDTAELVQE